MPSESKAQQRASGLALAAKRGEIPKSRLGPAVKQMAKMPERSLREYASTKHKGLPGHVSKKKGN